MYTIFTRFCSKEVSGKKVHLHTVKQYLHTLTDHIIFTKKTGYCQSVCCALLLTPLIIILLT